MSPEILRIHHLHKAFGAKQVLTDISFHLNHDDRAALVGENGVGKTTLTRLISGQENTDSGTIQVFGEIGFLPQEVTYGLEADLTIRRYIERSTGALDGIKAEMQTLETRMASDFDEAILTRYGDLQDEFLRRGGYELDYRIAQVFSGLQIDYLDQERVIHGLSGGEKTRVALAALLLRSPDLLILDEPTNHLDFVALEWLETYLADYQHALLLVSHDRHFINRVVNKIIELSPTTPGAAVYHGNYDDYLAEKEIRFQNALMAYENQREEIKRLRQLAKEKAFATGSGRPPKDNDKFYANFKGGRIAGHISQEIRTAKNRLAELEAHPLPHPARLWRISFDFEPAPLPSMEVISLHGLSKGYGQQVLFDNLTAVIQNGERVVMVAPNGTGKTTLLKIIMGMVEADAGEIRFAPGVRLGYLDQEQETLNLGQSVMDAFRESAPVGTDKERITQLHRSGLFSGDDLEHKIIGDLSVGQRRKLSLAKLIAAEANVLLLDEPTNHLDFASLEALEDALLTFPGVVLAVSHDRRFIQRIATRVWHLEDEKIRR